ncbi:DUF6098 family protein [Allorhizocola rhizosphaerae]|uniref:DUF6098 family protein n=1 Tax=Allorhizocola rhizosphaerae TaxID=1872709 RepID=UPI001B8BE0C2|nr:DUF6098 family protein [Allorhizocola rhizosphaerae]
MAQQPTAASGGPRRDVLGHDVMRTITDLDELARLVRDVRDEELYVRWSKGPARDLAHTQSSRDELTGVRLPGLSANPLAVEPWWGERPLRLWVARRLYDYRHLPKRRGPQTRPWVLAGTEIGRGPDNEPLVICRRPIAWIADGVLAEADKLVDSQAVRNWGPLDRG